MAKWKPTNHREWIERRLSEIEEQLLNEGLTVEQEMTNGSIKQYKHPLVDTYTQLIQALTKIAPDTIQRSEKLDLKSLMKGDK